MPTSSIAIPSKIYPNLEFWFENKPSGNPAFRRNFFSAMYYFVLVVFAFFGYRGYTLQDIP
jgi:hypothetical protein